MYNYFMIIGRVKAIQTKELSDEQKLTTVLVETQDYFKDKNGNYPTNVLEIHLMDYLVEVIQNNLKIDSTICIKGKIASKQLISKSESNDVILIAERVMMVNNK